MGRMHAEEMGSMLPRRQALEWHLKHNHYPPVDTRWIPWCEEILNAWDECSHDREVFNVWVTGRMFGPDGNRKSAWDVIDGLHLSDLMSNEGDGSDYSFQAKGAL